jgi:hypothetical protein
LDNRISLCSANCRRQIARRAPAISARAIDAGHFGATIHDSNHGATEYDHDRRGD